MQPRDIYDGHSSSGAGWVLLVRDFSRDVTASSNQERVQSGQEVNDFGALVPATF